jgi:D-alanyl-D-alanine endopeptidase (penicillin-binding protein 7)
VRSIASISKLMAMMVVLDRGLDLDKTTVIVDDDRKLAVRGARSRLPVGLTFTNRDLLHAALMASDNRAVPALGRAVGLAPELLAAEMTKKAIALGLAHTSFGDPTGLDDRNHSTPREVAKFLMAAIHYPLIAEITRKATYLARAVDTRRHYAVEYTNTDVWARGSRYQVLGGKTGYTDLAGYCLAIAAHLDGRGDVAMVFLGEQGKMTRFADFARAATWIAEKKPPALLAQAQSPASPSSTGLTTSSTSLTTSSTNLTTSASSLTTAAPAPAAPVAAPASDVAPATAAGALEAAAR